MTLCVLHVAQPVDGGVGRYVAAVAGDQAARGWRVGVACPTAGELPERLLELGVAHHPWEAGRSPGPQVAREARALASIVQATRPDAVHLHSSKAGLVGRLVLRGRRPTLFQPHGWSWLAPESPVVARASVLWERFAARWCDRLVCVSEHERDAGRGAGVRAHYVVVPNGVDLEAFPGPGGADRHAARERLGLPSDVALVVCVGRVTRQKGQDRLLAAWPAVRAAVPRAVLALVGDGDARQAWQQRWPAGESLLWVGSRQDVADWYVAADVVAFPSRWEGMALTLLEAMACGRPVVTTDVGGAVEALGASGDGPCGAVLSTSETQLPDALARAVVGRISDPLECERQGTAARRRVTRDFDQQHSLEALASLTRAVAKPR